jgi:GntR family transcriptional regulator
VYYRTAQLRTGRRGDLLRILISNTSDRPLYQQIKEQIKDAILKNELTEGDMLPSIRNLANDLRVSVLTIRRVYEELETEGFVTSQAGRGTFVASGNIELLRDSKRHLVEQRMQEVIDTAKSLSISKEELNAMIDILFEEDK